MEQFTFLGHQLLNLSGRLWHATSPKAVLMIVHGFGEHSGRYEEFARFMNEEKVTVMSYDLRGHGESPGKRGRIMQWDEHRKDFAGAVEVLKSRVPAVPFFVLGHSLGGVIVADAMLGEGVSMKPKGVILSSPLLGVPKVPEFKLAVGRVASRFFPWLTLKVVIDTDGLSRNEEVVRKYVLDPLVHSRANARFASELLKTQDSVRREAGNFSYPLLVVLGTGDRIVWLDPVRDFYRDVKLDDKHMEEFEDGAHELHNDIVSEDVLRVYVNWMQLRF